MPTPYDVPSTIMIERLARYLKRNVDEVIHPIWASIVKAGSHAERAPQDPDWWFTRCASILRKIYMKGPIGVARLRSEYGGRRNRGVRPDHARRGGGAIIRKALQQLDAAGFVEQYKNRGRILTKEGTRILDTLAKEIKKGIEKEMPELKKY